MVTGYEVYVGDHQTVSSRSTRRHHWTRSVCSAVVSPLVCYHCPIVTVYGRVDHCPIVTVYGRVDHCPIVTVYDRVDHCPIVTVYGHVDHCPIMTVYGRVDHCPIMTVYGRVDLWFPRLWCGLEHSKGGGRECGGSVGVWGCGAGCDHGL